MAQALIRPAVMAFLELATQGEHLDLQMEELTVEKAHASMAGPSAIVGWLRIKVWP
jgi:hypothetical protein